MDCSELLLRFSEYFDGSMEPEEVERVTDHLEECSSCRRYCQVVDRGVGLLRSLPEVQVSDDFLPRLRHRIYHLEDEEALSSRSGGSGTTVATAIVMALILSVVAWSPTLSSSDPEVTLSPIVVSEVQERTERSTGVSIPARAFFPTSPDLSSQPAGADLFDPPRTLLHEYSHLFDRSRQSGLVRTGIQ